jgi:hypothetical protein
MRCLELRARALPTVLVALLALIPLATLFQARGVGVIVPALLVVGMVALAVALARRRLLLDPTGVTAVGMLGARHIAWKDVDHYTFWAVDESAGYYVGLFGLIGVLLALAARRSSGHRGFSRGRLTLVGRRGTLVIDARYNNVAEALDLAFAELHPRLRDRNFTPYVLGDHELHHARKGTLGLADIERVSVSGTWLAIKRRGKRLAWARDRMSRVHNVMLLLEVLAERGLVVKPSSQVFVPPTVLDKLRAAASRHAALPQARVVSR